MGKRPQLTDELRVLSSMNGPTMIPSGEELEKSDAGVDMLKFLFDLFHKCVEQNPSKYVFSSIIVRGPTVIPFVIFFLIYFNLEICFSSIVLRGLYAKIGL